MARLNEAVPAPLDPVELLRRKYSRQNKEIARVNSTQCVRIRNLENEISRLLTENLELREQIIRLQSKAESSRGTEITNHIRGIKSKLEEKLLEVAALVTTLGDGPAQAIKTPTKSRIARGSPARTPDRKDWKNMCTLSEAAGLEDGRLPPILEDKFYPRRTLEPTELEAILSDPIIDNTDSPDIGPPPVSHFINEDPVQINLSNRVGESTESPRIDPTRSIHLEQRRKRKDGTGMSENKRPGRSGLNLSSSTEIIQSLKTGAKRKLSTRDDEEESSIKATETSPDDFKFTRRVSEDRQQSKASAATEKPGGKTSREIAVARGVSRVKAIPNISKTRKALTPKSVNSDVANSPKKAAKPVLLDDMLSSKSFAFSRESKRERPREPNKDPRLASCNNQSPMDTIDIQVEPEIPAALDLFSPQSSESLAVHTDSRDTPPPSELGQEAEGQRPSRRSRGSVSYAEPNLRDKMRRPTKGLVDAVFGEGKNQRISLSKNENDLLTTARKIKEEPEADDMWKSLPSAPSVDVYLKSPLVDKDQLPGTTFAQRSRMGSAHNSNDGEQPRSRSSSAISALIAGPRKAKQGIQEQSQAETSLENAIAQLDIYEFNDSSPKELDTTRTVMGREKYSSRTSKKLPFTAQDLVSFSDKEDLDGGVATQKVASSSASRRRQSMLGLGAPASNDNMQDRKFEDNTLKKSYSSSTLISAMDSNLKSERISARRRSMML